MISGVPPACARPGGGRPTLNPPTSRSSIAWRCAGQEPPLGRDGAEALAVGCERLRRVVLRIDAERDDHGLLAQQLRRAEAGRAPGPSSPVSSGQMSVQVVKTKFATTTLPVRCGGRERPAGLVDQLELGRREEDRQGAGRRQARQAAMTSAARRSPAPPAAPPCAVEGRRRCHRSAWRSTTIATNSSAR